MFVVPDFMAPAFSCRGAAMAYRWGGRCGGRRGERRSHHRHAVAAAMALSYAIDARAPVPGANGASWRGAPGVEGTRTPRHTDHGQRRQAPSFMSAAPVRRVLDADARVEARCQHAVPVVGERRARHGSSTHPALLRARHHIIRLHGPGRRRRP